jgi:hypothetical protein
MMDELSFLLIGAVAGAIYFATLRLSTMLYFGGAGGQAIGLHLARLAALVTMLTGMAKLGALPLLLCAFGVVSVRPMMMRLVP